MRGEKGYVLVLVAAMAACLMGAAALALDGGRAFLARRELQDAVDAAALAGAAQLPEDPSAAVQVALAYAARHGLNPGAVQVEVLTASEAAGGVPEPGERPTVVRVSARSDLGTTFARVWSLERVEVAARAQAAVSPVAGVRGVAPLGVPEWDFVPGARYALKVGAGNADRGNFQALALGGRGAANFEENLLRGWPQVMRVGDVVPTEPGNMSGATFRAIQERIASARPGETFEDYDPDSPRLLLVPVVDFSGVGGRDQVRVIGFACFYLEDCTGHGSDCWVYGRFVRRVVTGEMGAWDWGEPWYALAVKLTG